MASIVQLTASEPTAQFPLSYFWTPSGARIDTRSYAFIFDDAEAAQGSLDAAIETLAQDDDLNDYEKGLLERLYQAQVVPA